MSGSAKNPSWASRPSAYHPKWISYGSSGSNLYSRPSNSEKSPSRSVDSESQNIPACSASGYDFVSRMSYLILSEGSSMTVNREARKNVYP